MERPIYLEEEHLHYLDELRESGETNMFDAKLYLMEEFVDLTFDQATKVLFYWMKTFSERHQKE